jgi:hypothetical protein
MDQETKVLVERLRARRFVHDRDDICGEAMDRFFSDVQDRFRAEIEDDTYVVFNLALAVFLKNLTLKKALRLAASDEAAALYAEQRERENAWQREQLIPFRPKQ